MNEVICPNCKKAFKIDEAGYADILKQVRDTEFDKQLQERLALAEKDKNNAIELAKEKFSGQLRDALSEKENEISKLKAELGNADLNKSLADINQMSEEARLTVVPVTLEACKVVVDYQEHLPSDFFGQAKDDTKTFFGVSSGMVFVGERGSLPTDKGSNRNEGRVTLSWGIVFSIKVVVVS